MYSEACLGQMHDKHIRRSRLYPFCKENQPQLYENIHLYFETEVLTKDRKELEKSRCYYKEYCKEHGRIEKREYYITTEVNWLEEKKD